MTGTGATDGSQRPALDPERLLKYNNALQFISNGAWFLTAPFIPLYLVAQGASAGVVGAIIGVSAVIPLLMSIYAGALVDQRGPSGVAKVSVLLYAVASAVLIWLHGFWWVGVAYTMLGLANVGFAVAPQAIVAAISTPQTRIRNYGHYALWNSAGAVIGPVVGGAVAARYGYAATFGLMGMLMVPCYVVTAAVTSAPTVRRHTVSLAQAHTTVGAIVRRPGVGGIMFASGMAQWGNTLLQSFFPLYLQHVGLSANLIGIIIAEVSLASMLVRSLLIRGVTRFGYPRLLLGAAGLAVVFFGITPLLHGFWSLLVAATLMGTSLGFSQPLTMSLLVGAVGADVWGVAFGLRQSVQRVSTVFSPIVYGLIIGAYGLETGFFAGALTYAAAIPIMARMIRDITAGPDD